MDALIPCEACDRYIRASETECPFCSAPHAPVRLPAPGRRHVTRAAMVALALATTACGDDDAAVDAGDDVTIADAGDDAPATDAGDDVTETDAGDDVPVMDANTDVPPVILYGIPPMDAGTE